MNYAFAPNPVVSLLAMSSNPYPVNLIYCVEGNFPATTLASADNPSSEPVIFTKPATCIAQNSSIVYYPTNTRELKATVQLVVALHKGGSDIDPERVDYDYVFGYAVGLDLSRGDLQATLSAKGLPWAKAKGFDQSAPCTSLTPEFYSGVVDKGKIELKVNGEVRQCGDLTEMLCKVPDLVAYLSTQFELHPGDLIYTGSPEAAVTLNKGDAIEATIAGLEPLILTIA
ncbi:MAG: fumarylacetoacetate hydrolase [Methylobacter sp.]|nr:MAG: fumarylacetoacetate hydrolase [Methylobacter sp.]PPD23481.1 MAG: fumarylacetoacetate hydrolase [Methylobacter sp.]